MKRAVSLTVAVLVLALTPGLVPQASADHGWRAGAAFEIGGIFFNIGYRGDRDRHRRHDYYYRTRHHFGSRDHYHRGGRCFQDRGYYYHHESCPLVHDHLRRHRASLDHVFGYYAPDYDHRYRDRYYDDHRRPRRYRDHGHYRDRGRYRDHGHYRDDRGRGHHRGRGHDKHRGRGRGHDHHDHRGGYCPYDRH